ncbi:hypothetical protein [Pseudoalteromonas xiamenensis]|nr:hypothetical protein [Pseudoalteromonas xiamenensis]
MTKKSYFVWHNGEITPCDQATTRVLSHSIHYGRAKKGVFRFS